MSYILEAIKKAESERGNTRLYEKNYIDNSYQGSKKIPWVAIAIFVNAIILLVWISLQLFSNADVEKNSNAASAAEKTVQQRKELTSPVVLPRVVIDEQVETIELKNSKPTLLDGKHVSNSLDNGKPSFINETAKTELPADKVANVKSIGGVNKNILPAKVEPLPVVENLSLDEETQLVTESLSKVELPEESQINRRIPIVENSNVPSFNQLPYGLQQRIPDLAISVHIYNVAKEARKVRINGKLLQQGDAVNDDLIVQEITSYGVIFNYSGELFSMTLR
ncbi:MAG: general secretion pathway protein GspB [Gammaproteobacteria bacterium]